MSLQEPLADQSTPEDLATKLKTAIDSLKSSFTEDFVLIGGGSMIAYGSNRITQDLDILVRP
jgi:hypothetical protein